jgi:glycosyltransferase involved in cell wall biosynthesis
MLKKALISVTEQTIKPEDFEVIIVDDASLDETSHICNSFKELLPNLIYLHTGKNIGLGRARRLGIETAKGSYILFTDDDCIVSQNWVERFNYYLKDKPVVSGSVHSPCLDYITLSLNIAEFHAYMGNNSGYKDFIAGANMGFQREVLRELEDFKNISTGRHSDDLDLILQAREKNYHPYFASDVTVYHYPPRRNLLSSMKHFTARGRTSILLRNKYAGLLNTPFILKSSLLILPASPVIALKVTAGIYLQREFWKYICNAPLVYLYKLAWCYGAFLELKKGERKL